jgi:hypothetical protein
MAKVALAMPSERHRFARTASQAPCPSASEKGQTPDRGARGSKAARIVQRLRFLNNAKNKHIVFTSNVPLPSHLTFSDTQYVMEPLP